MLRRLNSLAADGFDGDRPFVAWLRELDQGDDRDACEQWVVLHRITGRDLQLIHWKPIAAKRLVVRIEISRNETLEVVVAVERSEPCGSLYGTSAKFYPTLAHQTDAS